MQHVKTSLDGMMLTSVIRASVWNNGGKDLFSMYYMTVEKLSNLMYHTWLRK